MYHLPKNWHYFINCRILCYLTLNEFYFKMACEQLAVDILQKWPPQCYSSHNAIILTLYWKHCSCKIAKDEGSNLQFFPYFIIFKICCWCLEIEWILFQDDSKLQSAFCIKQFWQRHSLHNSWPIISIELVISR